MNMENLIAVSNKLVEVNNKLTEVTKQRDTLVDALKEIYNVSLFDWETMPDESKNKYREIVLEMTNNSLAALKGENQ